MSRLRELYAKYICVCFKAQPNHYYQDKRGKDPFIVIGKNSCDLNLIESVIKKSGRILEVGLVVNSEQFSLY